MTCQRCQAAEGVAWVYDLADARTDPTWSCSRCVVLALRLGLRVSVDGRPFPARNGRPRKAMRTAKEKA